MMPEGTIKMMLLSLSPCKLSAKELDDVYNKYLIIAQKLN